MKQSIWEVVWLLIWLGEVELVEKSIANASQNDNYPKFSKMWKNYSAESDYITRDSAVLLIFTYFYIVLHGLL